MSGSTFGKIFRVTTFGESHGPVIGAVIEGCPAGLELDLDFIQAQLDKRKPGQSQLTTQRKETDRPKILSGVFEGKSTGTPLAMMIENVGARAKDYEHLAETYRPSHADYTYQAKFGTRDYLGGGRSSARETAARVFAGAIAQLLLRKSRITVAAYVSQVGPIICPKSYDQLDLSKTSSQIRCPDETTAEKMMTFIDEIREQGDSIGGVITGVVRGCPAGLGEPVFDRLHADLGKAMLSINAVKGFEIGSGFSGVSMRGSEHNDSFVKRNERIETTSNHSGGIQGGIANGMDIYFRVAFKPVATIMKEQTSIDKDGHPVKMVGRGRHDPCVLPRAVAIVEAMTALTLVDHLLRQRLAKV